jgi:hypothetical protein
MSVLVNRFISRTNSTSQSPDDRLHPAKLSSRPPYHGSAQSHDRSAASHLAYRTMVEELIWLLSLASGRIPPVDCS